MAFACASCQHETCRRARALARYGMGDWPAPETPARPPEDGEVPAGARRVADVAKSAGWRVVATYARGTYPGRPPRVVDSVALRMRRDGSTRIAVAVWHGTRFAFAITWGADCPLRRINVTQLRGVLELTS